MTDSPDDFDAAAAALAADVADDFCRRRARGEDPDPEEYVARHPKAAEAIRGVLAALRLAAPCGRRAPDPPPAGQLGDFRIVREAGRGGMGVVYEAEQVSLGRRVALKVLPFAALADPRLLQRFKNEARAAAALDHPHIVKVHAVGEERGTHYLAMQFIDGRPLSDLIAAVHARVSPDPTAPTVTLPGNPEPLPVPASTAPADRLSTLPAAPADFSRRAAELGVQAAEALEHAHALGVVHRDVKPGNLLVDARGDVWVSDFGLAKLASADAAVTLTGDVFGTLRYMSPEQALAKHDLVDHRTDIYSLGATLYELLTGHPAVDGKDKAEVLRRITDAEPAPPRKWNRAVPADLETVVLKCLRKEPNDRYASAKELADDLRRFLKGEPVRAKPIGPAGRWLRWAGRHPLPVLLTGLTAVAVGVAIALGVWTHYRAAADRAALAAAAEREEGKAEQVRTAQEATERQRFFALLEQVRQRRADPYAGWSGENLKVLRELPALPQAEDYLHDLRSEAAAALSALDLLPAGVLGPDFAVCGLDYSPDGKLLAAGRWAPAPDDATRVRLYDAATGEVVRELVIPGDADSAQWKAESDMVDRVDSVRFSPNGKWLAAGTGSGRVALWKTRDLAAGPRVWTAHTDRTSDNWRPGWHHTMVDSVFFTPDGKTLWSGTRSAFRAWFLDGRPAGPLVKGFRLPNSLPPSADRLPATREQQLDLQVLDLGTGAVVPDTRRAGKIPLAVAPGGRLVAYMPTRTRGPPVLQAIEPGAPARILSSRTGAADETPDLEYMAFDSTGGLLVSVEQSPPRVKLWDVAAGRLVTDQTAPFDIVRAAFRPDGRRLAIGGRKGVALFDLPNRVLDTVGVVAEEAVESMAASPDHRELWVTGRDTRGSGPTVPARVYRQGLGPGSSPVASEVLELPPFRSLRPFAEWWSRGQTAVFAHGGTSPPDLISPAGGPSWDIPANRKLKAIKCGPDGRFWMVDEDSLLEVHPGHPIQPGPRHALWQNDPEWAPKGLQIRSLTAGRRWVFVGRRDGMVVRVDAATESGTEWPLLTTPADGLAMSPDDTRLLVGGEGGEVRLVDVETGAATVVPDAHRAEVPAVAFGRRLFVTGSADRRVRLWTLDGRPLATLRMQGPVRKVLLSDDERSLLVLVEGERAVRRWRLDVLFQEWRALGLGDDLPPV